MLPSGKFARAVLATALLLALLLVLDLEFVRSAAASLLASNALDLAMFFLAALCAFYAARRSSGYARQLWLLLAVALSLNAIAQAITTYYQSFVPAAARAPWPSDVLFFVWVAPVFMMFLPRSEEDSSTIDALRLLDFLQVAIVAVTIYVYFFYSPARWQTDQPSLLRQILVLYIARDLILSLAFFFRSRTNLPSWLRSFSLVLAFVFVAAVLSDADYLFNLGATVAAASWGDLVAMLPYFLVVLLAIYQKRPDPLPLSPSTSPFGTMVATQVLPIATPLIVILMGRTIAREQLLFAWLAVSASVLCSSIRLILTNRRQRRISDSLLTAERALRSSEEILSTAFRNSPDAFSINPFPNGPYLEVNDGYTHLTGYTRDEVLGKTPREMNLWVDLDKRDLVVSALRESGHVRDVEFRFRTKSNQIRAGQMSASVVDLHGQRCTLVIVRDITARKEAEEILRSSEERFRSLVSDFHFAVVLHSPDARIEFANRAAHQMFHLPDGAAIGKLLPELGISVVDQNGNDIPQANRPVLQVLRTRVPIYDALIGFRYPGSPNILWTYGNIVPQFDIDGELIRLVSSFADVTGMKNAERAIHNLSTQLLKLQDEERRRIGRELHDGLAQTVLAINLSLAQVRQSLSSQQDVAARSLERARALTQQMSREIRTLSYLLHPPLLDDLGLVSTLKEYVHGFSERSGITTEIFSTIDFQRLPQPVEIALFRIVQESLANIQRHSGSSTAEIHLTQQNSTVALEIIDHGHGMHVPALSSTLTQNVTAIPSEARNLSSLDLSTPRQDTASAVPSSAQPLGASAPEGIAPDANFAPIANHESRVTNLGVGIPGMCERMAQLGGSLEIISGPTGTIVRATISLPASPTESLDAFFTHLDR